MIQKYFYLYCLDLGTSLTMYNTIVFVVRNLRYIYTQLKCIDIKIILEDIDIEYMDQLVRTRFFQVCWDPLWGFDTYEFCSQIETEIK